MDQFEGVPGPSQDAFEALNSKIAKYDIYNSNSILVQKTGNIVSFRSVNGNVKASDIRNVTIPSAYRPFAGVDIPLFAYSSSSYAFFGYVNVHTDGSVDITGTDGNTSSANFNYSCFNGCWVI